MRRTFWLKAGAQTAAFEKAQADLEALNDPLTQLY